MWSDALLNITCSESKTLLYTGKLIHLDYRYYTADINWQTPVNSYLTFCTMVLNDTGIITVCQNYMQDIGRFLYRPHVLSATKPAIKSPKVFVSATEVSPYKCTFPLSCLDNLQTSDGISCQWVQASPHQERACQLLWTSESLKEFSELLSIKSAKQSFQSLIIVWEDNAQCIMSTAVFCTKVKFLFPLTAVHTTV